MIGLVGGQRLTGGPFFIEFLSVPDRGALSYTFSKKCVVFRWMHDREGARVAFLFHLVFPLTVSGIPSIPNHLSTIRHIEPNYDI